MNRGWAVALPLCLAVAHPLAAQDPAPAPSAPGLSADERGAMGTALMMAGLSPADLQFRKEVFPADAPLVAVQQALRDPLGALDAASHALQGLARPSARSAEAFGAMQFADPAETKAAPLDVGTREEQLQRLRVASPELSEPTRRSLKRLPAPVLAMLGELCALLAQPPESGVRSVVGQVSDGLRALRPNERLLIRSWGLRHTVAPDEAFNAFQPRPMPAAEATVAGQSGFGDPKVAVLAALARVDRAAMAGAADRLVAFADRAALSARFESVVRTHADPAGLVSGGIVARVPTRYGDIVIGGREANRYLAGAAQFIIDLGGDDTYAGALGGTDGTPGRPVSLLMDVSGNDTYESEAPFSFGGALLGVAVCVDQAGDDTYRGTLVTQGAAVGGAGVLFDRAGADHYVAERHAQGAALGGVGLLSDGGGQDDHYRVVTFGQGFGRTAGVGMLHDAAGNDTYEGGGEYPYLPQAPEHSYSHCQGYGIGVREQGFAGGVGVLLDRAGNDTYRASMHAQGGATWYALGILADLEGNDTYEAVFNAQGASVHLAAGMLIDGGGDDRYTLTGADPAFGENAAQSRERAGMGQGSAHDFAVGILHDRGGNDRYSARAGAQGAGFTTGLGIFVDRSGNDVYEGDEGHLQGCGRRNRQLPSLGVFVDGAGEDVYATGRVDGDVWVWSDIGVGIDAGPGAGQRLAPLAKRGDQGDKVLPPNPLPPVAAHLQLTAPAFQALWARATLWNVGEARGNVRAARDEIVAWGPRALPHIEAAMRDGRSWTGLVLWAIDDVLGLIADTHRDAVRDSLKRVTEQPNRQERIIGMLVGARLQMPAVSAAVLEDVRTGGIRRFAVTAAAQLRLPEAVPAIKELAQSPDETEVATAFRAMARYGANVGLPELYRGLRHPSFLVRDAAARGLASKGEAAIPLAAAILADRAASAQAKVWALFAVSRMQPGHVRQTVPDLKIALVSDVPELRAAAAEALGSLRKDEEAGTLLRGALAGEQNPGVRWRLKRALGMWDGTTPLRGEEQLYSGLVQYPDYFGGG